MSKILNFLFIILLLSFGVSSAEHYTKFGTNLDLDTAWEPIADLGGDLKFYKVDYDTAGLTVVVSDSTGDSASGNGIRTLRIIGVDSDLNEIRETATLAGTTPDTLSNSFLYINRMYALTTGNSRTSAGTITATITGNAVSRITEGNTQTEQTNFIVPRVEYGSSRNISYYQLRTYRVTVNKAVSAVVDCMPMIMLNGDSFFRNRDRVTVSTTGTSTEEFDFDVKLFPGDVVYLRAISSVVNAQVSGNIHWDVVKW